MHSYKRVTLFTPADTKHPCMLIRVGEMLQICEEQQCGQPMPVRPVLVGILASPTCCLHLYSLGLAVAELLTLTSESVNHDRTSEPAHVHFPGSQAATWS